MVEPLVQHYGRCTAEERDDLRQVALVGLIRAAELYRHDRQVPFSAFARPHIRGAVLHYLRDLAPMVRTPRRVQEALQRLRLVQQRLHADLGREPSVGELQGALGLSAQQWIQLQVESEHCRQLRSLLSPQTLDQACGEQEHPDTDAADVLALLQGLKPGERNLLEQVVLRGNSLRSVARELGISAATVHRQLHRALARLRTQLNPASAAPGC